MELYPFGQPQSEIRRERLLYNKQGYELFKNARQQDGEVAFAKDFNRVVVGDRGSYFEFETEHLIKENVFIPTDAQWRITPKYWKNVYYYEYRTTVGNLKLYYQRKTVTYADYIVGKWYVSTEVAYSDTPPTNSVQVITGPECEVSRG